MTTVARLLIALLVLPLALALAADAQPRIPRPRVPIPTRQPPRGTSDSGWSGRDTTALSQRGANAPARPPSLQADNARALAELDTYAPLVYDRPFPPAVVMESVLSGLWMLPSTGDLKLETFRVSFPPEHDAEGNDVDYAAQMRLHVRLTDAAGTLLMDRYYIPRGGFDNRVFTQFGVTGGPINRRDLARLNEGDAPLVLTEPGAYRLEFLFDDRPFWSMPFEVVRMEDPDPYAQAGPRYVLRGPWDAFGFIGFGELHTRAQPSSRLYWHAYTQLDELGRTSASLPLALGLYRGGRLVGEAHVDEVQVRDERRLEAWPFRAPGGGDVTLDDLEDGSYEVRFAIGDGPARAYPFEVRGGEVVPQGRQRREPTNPLEFIEGLNETWWLQPR